MGDLLWEIYISSKNNYGHIEKALGTMKSNKSLDPRDIPAVLTYSPRKMHQMLINMFSRCVNGIEPPREFIICFITPIHKKGRGITAICAIGRLGSKIVRNKIEEKISHKISEEKCGFRAGRSTVDNIFTLRQITEKKPRRERKVLLGIINLQKAYDSVPVNILWIEMRNLSIDKKINRINCQFI